MPLIATLPARFASCSAYTRDRRAELDVDLTLSMKGFDFETVWREHRMFVVDEVPIPVARLRHIVTSKHATGRDKDRLFLATHSEALDELLRREKKS